MYFFVNFATFKTFAVKVSQIVLTCSHLDPFDDVAGAATQ